MSGLLKKRTCEICNSTYQPTYSKQRTCGRPCGVKLRRKEHTYPQTDARTEEAQHRRASYQHLRALRHSINKPLDRKARAHAYYKQHYAKNKNVYYLAAYKRRALVKTTQHEHINRTDVFERDNWTCQICHTKVRDDVQRGHPKKAIMGHINALAAGGTHTWENVCCLCHRCNTRDGVNRTPIQTTVFSLA